MEKIRLANIITNDVLNGEGICTSIWLQGCPHHCPGCHNPETWDFKGGQIYEWHEAITLILERLRRNGIKRNLSILGGEPLCHKNAIFTAQLATAVKKIYPDTIIYCWTGYTFEELDEQYDRNCLLKNIDVLIEGRYIQKQRDITLKWRGSSNQRILYKGQDY